MANYINSPNQHFPLLSASRLELTYRSKSFILCHSNFGVRGSRLCIELLLGSSRIIRLTMIFSSRSVNQPFEPRNQLAVEVGLDGIRTNARRPAIRVISPSIRKSQRQPARPSTPRRWRRPKARNPPITSARADAVQKNPRRSESSWCL